MVFCNVKFQTFSRVTRKITIVAFKEELNFNKKCLEEVQKELNNAKDEIKGRKDLKKH